MVQEFHVVRCFSCQSFQVQQVKKVNKWSCKLCGEKQSLLKEFGRGSGADCRRHVQKLNVMRGAKMEEQAHNTWKQVEADREDELEDQRDDQVTQTQVSRWSKYLDTPEEAEPEEEEEGNVLMDRQQLHGNNMIDRKRKRSEGWTHRSGQDSCTPEQSNWSSLKRKPVRPPTTTGLNHTSLSHTSPPSLNPTGLNPTSLNTTGLNPTGLNPTRLNPTGLNPTSLNTTGLNPTSLNTTGLNPTGLNPTGLNPTSLNTTGLNPTGLNPTRLNPTGLNPTSLNTTGLNHTGLNPTGLNPTSLNPTSLNTTGLNHTSLSHTSPPSLNHTGLNPTGLNPTGLNPTGLNTTSLNTTGLNPTGLSHTSPPSLSHTSPPSKQSLNPPSVSPGPVSRWARFLSPDCQVNEEGQGPPVSGRSQLLDRAASLSCNDIITQTLPLPRPHPSLPVFSMFQSGDEFNFDDDEFLTADRL